MSERTTQWQGHDALRPRDLDSFTGQRELVRELRVVLGAAREAGRLPDHLLFAGPPGLGKTTLAHVVAHELGLNIISTSGPAIARPGDLAALVSGINHPSVLFIDEIHRLELATEELLYPVMEDGYLDLIVGEKKNGRALRVPLEPLVVVGATTQFGLLGAPLRDRFGYIGRLRLYDDEALAAIVTRSAHLLGLEIDEDAARAVAGRSRGTPRVANVWLRRVRDVAVLGEHPRVTIEVVEEALELFGVDSIGLDALGREVLSALCTQFNGGPVGLSTLAAAVGEAAVTLEEVYEPFLMRRGLLARTPRGRVATPAAYAHLGLTPPISRLFDSSDAAG